MSALPSTSPVCTTSTSNVVGNAGSVYYWYLLCRTALNLYNILYIRKPGDHPTHAQANGSLYALDAWDRSMGRVSAILFGIHKCKYIHHWNPFPFGNSLCGYVFTLI